MKEFILKNRRNIKAIIRNITGQENEDLEQEVYIKVWRQTNVNNDQKITRLSQWVNKVTSNTCKDCLKSKQYKTQQMKIEDETAVNEIKDSKTPEKILNSKQRQKMILKAIERLPNKQKEVIILYEFEQKSYEEISKIVGVPVGTVKSRLFCAREILKDELSELIGD